MHSLTAHPSPPPSLLPSPQDNQTFSQKYLEELDLFLNTSPLASPEDRNPHAYRTFTYDAVYAMAFALNKSENELQMNNLSLRNFRYSDTDTVRDNTTISDVIFQHMNETNFHGVSVSILYVYNSLQK